MRGEVGECGGRVAATGPDIRRSFMPLIEGRPGHPTACVHFHVISRLRRPCAGTCSRSLSNVHGGTDLVDGPGVVRRATCKMRPATKGCAAATPTTNARS